ncbi:dihydroorotate dehydrogenase electron transfer subunit [Pullulanibacillus pueri]|uniref:Dihydroorotate dehydrogenase B (NAD(+)), electron transfer subunit n=1 Tax=Pullulanibacillus pueri TaxID=1437324 RepID=A0A8J3EKH1_9BACL|nr:dihydroorotate dehydrogenase electron transfer subunit [Pullulanibacillus pueri]MBM7680163.1 dihydroorotate dehydrogenase electron transfer subunit [Pullulanibacillus pueri]GGH74656.1 dihydroorotate dehydrogenase B (NAD(+)), electron transfer subunit [Pullulanibacillus pueri]
MKQVEKMTIIKHRCIAENIYELTLQGELVQSIEEPGQFVHLRVDNGYETLIRRPISLANVNKKAKECTLIYRVEGEGTTRLSLKCVGDRVDVLGPLGHGFPLAAASSGGRALLVGGGVGVPPLYYLSKALKQRGIQVTHVLGFASSAVAFYEEEFRALGPTYLASVDGSIGSQGFVTDVIRKENLAADVIYACGPTPMLKALEVSCPDQPLYLSLEERMACGIGACMACVCHTQTDPEGSSYKKICKDGPVFKAGEVVLG